MSVAFIEELQRGLTLCGASVGSVLVGVSGGSDSVALLRGLNQLAESQPGLAIHVMHVNHRLRPTAAGDADWVRSLANELSVPCEIEAVDVAALAAADGIGVEEAARSARYEILVRHAQKLGCRFVAVAHHQDDNVETVLHHIVRGTGIAGLSGIPRTRQLVDGVMLIRPMLDISRQSATDYLGSTNSDYRVDESNADTSFTRNRIRLELLPLLERDFNPQVRSALQRLSTQASEVTAVVDQRVAELLERVCSVDGDAVRVRCDLLRDVPTATVRDLIRAVWKQQGWPRKKMGFAEWESLAEVVAGKLTGRDLPGGVNVSRRKAMLILTFNAQPQAPAPST